MLGVQIGEGRGKRTGRRVVATEPDVSVETSFEDSSTALGVAGANIGTYTARLRPDGSLCGEGRGVFLGQDGSVATWIGIGTGKLLQGGAVSYRGSLVYSTTSPALARLNTVAGVFEFEVDGEGNTQSKIWEWK